jgi:hypothetical protein
MPSALQRSVKSTFLAFLTLLPVAAFAADEAQVRALHESTGAQGSTARMLAFSQLFQGTPYGIGPLGEGPSGKYDQDPLYRFDEFDCTTFVETVIALSKTASWDGFQDRLRRIRYLDGKIEFTTRNHFTDLDWIRNNVPSNGFRDITDAAAPGKTLIAEALIDKPGWYSKHQLDLIRVPGASETERSMLLDELRAEGRSMRAEISRLPYIPIDWLFSLSQTERGNLLWNIPSGTVINIVRPNWDLTAAGGTHMNVSHQGLLFFDFSVGKMMMHHASVTTQRVVAMPLEDYLRPYIGHATLKGFNLVTPGW